MDDTASASQRRRRPILACDPCRRKKIKCDHEVPCGPCKRSRTSRCSYLESGGGDDTAVAAKKLRAGSTTSETPASISASASVVGSDVSGQSSPAVHQRAPWFDNGRTLGVLHSSLSQATLSSLGLDSDGSHFVDRQESPLGRGTFIQGRFYGPSHWMSFFLHLPNAESDYTLLQDYEPSLVRSNSGGSSLGGVSVSVTSSSSGPSPMLAETIPRREVSNQLVLAYLRTFESVLRILHVPSFITECQQYWESPHDVRPSFLIMLGLVMAIGATFAPHVPDQTTSLWVEAGEDWVGQVLGDLTMGDTTAGDSMATMASYRTDNGKGIELVQIFCLLLESRQTRDSEPRQNPPSVLSVDSLVRAAESTALHIDPTKLPGLSFFEQETRRRLWSTVQELALQAAIDEGRQSLLVKPESSGSPPMNLADEQFGPHTQTAPPASSNFTHTSMQIALHRSLPTRLTVADAINDVSNPICSYPQALQLSSQILTESQDILSRIQTQPPGSFGARLCELLLYRLLLTLHVPFALQARTDPTRYYSRKVATEVAMSILRGALGAPGSNEDDFTKLMRQGNQLFGRAPVLAASVLCYDLVDVEPFSSNLTQAAFPATRTNLQRLVETYLQFLSQRIAVNADAIRPFVLLSSQMARIDEGGGQTMDNRLGIHRAFRLCQQLRQNRNVVDTPEGHFGDEISVVSSGESYVLERQSMSADPNSFDMKSLNPNEVAGSFASDDPWMMGFS